MTQKALITGVTGQDGAYLAEFMPGKGYEVHGIKRRTSLFNTDRIDHLYQDPHEQSRRFILHHGVPHRQLQPHPHHPAGPARRNPQPRRAVACGRHLRRARIHRQLRGPGRPPYSGGHPHSRPGKENLLIPGKHLRGQGIHEKGYDTHCKCIVAVNPRYFRPTEVAETVKIAIRGIQNVSDKVLCQDLCELD